MTKFSKSANVPFSKTPFKSPGDQNNAVISGEAPVAYALAPSAVPLIKAGKVGNSWEGLFAPAKTPQPIVLWLAAETKKAVEDPATA